MISNLVPPKTNFNFSAMGNPNTVQPIGINVQTNTSGTTTPKGLSMQTSVPQNEQPYGGYLPAGGVTGLLKPPAQTYAATPTGGGNIQGDTTINNGAIALTPQEIATKTGQTYNPQNASVQTPAPSQTQSYSSTNPPTYTGLVSTLANKSSGPSQDYLDQQARANAFNDQLVKSKQEEATQLQQNSSQPFTLAFGGGREQQIQKGYLDQQNALATGFQGASTLVGAANTQQSTQQQGLTSAVSATAPILGAYGQANYGIGGNTGGGGIQPTDPFYATLQNYAKQAAAGQYSSIPSSITGNAVLNDQMNQMAKQINPAYNPITSTAQGNVLSTIPALESANTAADGIKNKIQSYLSANPQLNPSELAAGNVLQQWIQGKQLTDPKYQTLFNYLDEYTNTLVPILGVGGNPTNLKTEIAQGFINGAASGASISEVLNNMAQLAAGKIQDIRSGATGGGTVSNSTTGNTSSIQKNSDGTLRAVSF